MFWRKKKKEDPKKWLSHLIEGDYQYWHEGDLIGKKVRTRGCIELYNMLLYYPENAKFTKAVNDNEHIFHYSDHKDINIYSPGYKFKYYHDGSHCEVKYVITYHFESVNLETMVMIVRLKFYEKTGLVKEELRRVGPGHNENWMPFFSRNKEAFDRKLNQENRQNKHNWNNMTEQDFRLIELVHKEKKEELSLEESQELLYYRELLDWDQKFNQIKTV